MPTDQTIAETLQRMLQADLPITTLADAAADLHNDDADTLDIDHEYTAAQCQLIGNVSGAWSRGTDLGEWEPADIGYAVIATRIMHRNAARVLADVGAIIGELQDASLTTTYTGTLAALIRRLAEHAPSINLAGIGAELQREQADNAYAAIDAEMRRA